MKFWKWWTVFGSGIISMILGHWYFDLFVLLNSYDATKISFAIALLAILFSVLGGVQWKTFSSQRQELHWFVSDALLSLGMIGTLIGFLIVLGQAFSNIDPSNIESMTAAIGVLATGMSTALVTTLTGLSFSLWLKLQLVILDE